MGLELISGHRDGVPIRRISKRYSNTERPNLKALKPNVQLTASFSIPITPITVSSEDGILGSEKDLIPVCEPGGAIRIPVRRISKRYSNTDKPNLKALKPNFQLTASLSSDASELDGEPTVGAGGGIKAPVRRISKRYSNTERPKLCRLRDLALSTQIWKSQVVEDPAIRSQKVKDRWRQIGKCIMMVSSVSSQFHKLELTRKELEIQQDQMKHFLEHRFDVDSKFVFDPSFYKRPKDGIFFSRELEEVGQNRSKRTNAQIRSLRLTLRDCHSIGAYPDYVQTEISRLGCLERYGRGRIVLREGHAAARVYFILSGTVVITRFNKETKAEETMRILHKGDTFGDTEVLAQTSRTSTATSASDVMLWSIEGQDFKNSMIRNVMENKTVLNNSFSRITSAELRAVPDTPVPSAVSMTAKSAVHRFLSSLKWFEDMPTNKFLDDAKCATLVYFRNNKTIVQSSKNNDFLYFVRGGKCDVVARISIESSSRSPSNMSCFDTGMMYFDEKKVSKIRPVTGIIRRDQSQRINELSRPKTAPHLHAARPVSSYKLDTTRNTKPISNHRAASACVKPKKSTTMSAVTNRPKTACTSRNTVTHEEFLKVVRLEEGDVFGLTSLFGEEDLETSLISRGCECVIVHKDTFRLLLNKQNKDKLKSNVLFYPSYEEMKKKLLNFYAWKVYKDSLKLKR